MNGHQCVRWAGHLDLHWTIGKFTGWTDAGADPEPHDSGQEN